MSVSTCVSFFSTCSPSLGAQALRSVEVNDPSAGEKANREFIVDESDCPYFKLGVIQALRYRNPSVLFGDDCETGWMKQVCVFNAQLHCEEPLYQYLLRWRACCQKRLYSPPLRAETSEGVAGVEHCSTM